MAKKTFYVKYEVTVTIEVDETLIDELPAFQKSISANVTDLKGLAGHIAWNLGIQNFKEVDGLVGLEDKYQLIDVDAEQVD